MAKEKQFKFTVIMAVYNAAKYVSESIDSLVNQTINFEENIQLILVNDGSTDSSEVICKKYADMYPDNITYIYKKNGGASSARNLGLKYRKGKYINFMDSDDIITSDTFAEVY